MSSALIIPPPSRTYTAPVRAAPMVPDYELLRYIGGGAYGEVWLARGLTGTMRAVKVIRREDFAHTKTFEREFEGIREFEPVSRAHPGLVDVLHVGWIAEAGFYYYVMELADDCEGGPVSDALKYQPKTLTAELERTNRIGILKCIQIGRSIAEALHHLHIHGLAHRDVKPSNIIFVGSVCKLADVGLVAAAGQQNYVGTEGFVPPEGPGTSAADIYSLGKVLYEISTGKDRHDFPALPDDFTLKELRGWRLLNTILCKACAPKPQKRHSSAAALAAELLKAGEIIKRDQRKRQKRRFLVPLLGLLATSAGCGFILSSYYSRVEPELSVFSPPPLVPPIANQIEEALRLQVFGGMNRDGELEVPPEDVAPFPVQPSKPEPRGRWINSLGMRFLPYGEGHLSQRPITLDNYDLFMNEAHFPFEGTVTKVNMPGETGSIMVVVVPKTDAEAFARWLGQRDQRFGYHDADHAYRVRNMTDQALDDQGKQKKSAFLLESYRETFGSVTINSDPPGAVVVQEGKRLGMTPFIMDKVRIGENRFELELNGFKRKEAVVFIKVGERTETSLKLEKSENVIFGLQWKNSLGMEFVPLDNDELAVWETRNIDWQTWLIEAKKPLPALPSGMENYPVTGVSRQNAEEFCRWLTAREQKTGLISKQNLYTLPTDEEWSRAVGLTRERGDDPAGKHDKIWGVYPWGPGIWPPPPRSGNYADESARTYLGDDKIIPDWRDDYAGPSPVGTFAPNFLGCYDLGGNVWEWVRGNYGGADPKKRGWFVVRGGAWTSFDKDELRSSHRRALPSASAGDSTIGFRCILKDMSHLSQDK